MILKDLVNKERVLNGIWHGEVVDNKDPLNLFRVKVKIPGLTDNINIEALPWYLIIQSNKHTMNMGGTSLPIGAKVLVEFPNKNIYDGIVIGMATYIPPNLKG